MTDKKIANMGIEHFKTGPLSVNTFIVYNKDTGEGFIIDPGGNYKSIVSRAGKLGVRLLAQLFTHGHFDHCGAGSQLQKDGIDAYIHSADADKLKGRGSLSYLLGIEFDGFTADYMLSGGQVLDIAGFKIEVLHTPGHSAGSVCYVAGDIIFSGDTLFNMSVGRTDFPDGDAGALNKSITQKLFSLKGDYHLYPGHDELTTLEYQRLYNPYVEHSVK